jgi:hypothetical protein
MGYNLGYVAWAFKRTLRWTLALYALVLTEVLFHRAIELGPLFGVSLLAWLILFIVFLSDARNKARYWRAKHNGSGWV